MVIQLVKSLQNERGQIFTEGMNVKIDINIFNVNKSYLCSIKKIYDTFVQTSIGCFHFEDITNISEFNPINSDYNEDTADELTYYIDCKKHNIGDIAYLYSKADDTLTEMEIIHIVCNLDDMDYYNELLQSDDILIDGESFFNADTSAEFISDDACYLVWFKYTNKN